MEPTGRKAGVTRAIIYTRISQDQSHEGAGVARQEEACRQLAASRGWVVIEEKFEDNYKSAFSGTERPAFDRALTAAANGECEVIIAWAIDRLTRSLKDLIRLIESATEHGVGVITATGDIDLTTATGRMVATILAAVAAQEMESKGARQKLANVQNAKAGGKTKGVRAFGFEDDKVTVREVEAEAIRLAARDVLDGASLGSIARRWTEAGFTSAQTRDGKATTWSMGGVRFILKSPRYIGKRVYKGEVMGDAEWDAILDETTFYALEFKLTDPLRNSAPGYKRSGFNTPGTLLGSLARCGKCGGRVRSNTASLAGKRSVATYSCREASCFSMHRENAERVVLAEVMAWAHQEVIPSFIPGFDEGSPIDAIALRRELTSLLSIRQRIATAQGSGKEDYDVSETKLAANAVAIDNVKGRMKLAEKGSAREGLALADSPEKWWDGLTIARKREVIHDIMVVELQPASGRGVHAVWSEGLVTITPIVAA